MRICIDEDTGIGMIETHDVHVIVLDYSDSKVYTYICHVPDDLNRDEVDYIEDRLMLKHKLSQIDWMVSDKPFEHVDGGRI